MALSLLHRYQCSKDSIGFVFLIYFLFVIFCLFCCFCLVLFQYIVIRKISCNTKEKRFSQSHLYWAPTVPASLLGPYCASINPHKILSIIFTHTASVPHHHKILSMVSLHPTTRLLIITTFYQFYLYPSTPVPIITKFHKSPLSIMHRHKLSKDFLSTMSLPLVHQNQLSRDSFNNIPIIVFTNSYPSSEMHHM